MAKSQSSPTTNIGIIKGLIAVIVVATLCGGWLLGRIDVNAETLLMLLMSASQLLSSFGFIQAEDVNKVIQNSRFKIQK